jgi:hypothetical protein
MAWTDPLDQYCERLDPTFWAEPVNAVSNVAFLLAALWGVSRARKTDGSYDFLILSLSALIAVIGIGSFLFHTFANRWSELADVIPITIFIYMAFFAIMLRLFGFVWWWALVATALFLDASLITESLLQPVLSGSAAYVPALVAIAGIGATGLRFNPAASKLMLMTAAIFMLSLTLRILDLPLCNQIPLGTHFLWHIFNALTLALIIEVLRRARINQCGL